jgi:predicted metalloprotease
MFISRIKHQDKAGARENWRLVYRLMRIELRKVHERRMINTPLRLSIRVMDQLDACAEGGLASASLFDLAHSAWFARKNYWRQRVVLTERERARVVQRQAGALVVRGRV